MLSTCSPYLQTLVLEHNNIQNLHQLDVLAPLGQLTELQIGSGNPVTCVTHSRVSASVSSLHFSYSHDPKLTFKNLICSPVKEYQ
jgi:hypothetical protein